MSEPASEQVPFTHEFTVDAEYQRALTRALFWTQFRAVSPWIIIGFFLFALGVSILGRVSVFVVVWVILLVLMLGLRYLRVRGVVRTGFPIGKQMRSGFGATHFVISDGADSSVISYAGYDEIQVGTAVVWLRRRSPKRRMAFPRALFPDAEVARIRPLLAGAVSSADSPQPTPGTRA